MNTKVELNDSRLQLAWHPRGAIQPNDNTVEHNILNNLLHQHGELLRLSRPERELHGLGQAQLDLLGHVRRHARVEHAGGDGDDTDAEPREVSCHGQRHAGHGALGRRISDLAHLSLERGGAGHHYDDAALAVAALGRAVGERGEELADEVERAAQVDGEGEVYRVDGDGVLVLVEDLETADNTI